MKDQDLKYSTKEIIAIIAVWLFTLGIIYLIYLKVRMIIS